MADLPEAERGTICVVLGRLALDRNDEAAALRCLADPAVASSPLWEFGFHWRAGLLVKRGAVPDAVPLWEALFKAEGEPSFREEAASALADVAQNAQRGPEAIPYLEALRTLHPDDADLAARLAALYEAAGLPDLAAPIARQLWIERPGPPSVKAFFSAHPRWPAGFAPLSRAEEMTRLKALADQADWGALAGELPRFKAAGAEEEDWRHYLDGRLAESRHNLSGAVASYRAVKTPGAALWASTERMGRLVPAGVISAKSAQAVEEAVMGLPRTYVGREKTLLFLMRWHDRQNQEDRALALARALLSPQRAQSDACAYLYRKAWERWMAGRRPAAEALWQDLRKNLPPAADYRHAAGYTLMRLGRLGPADAETVRDEILREDRYGYFGYRLRNAPPDAPPPPPASYAEIAAAPGTHLAKGRELLRVGLASTAATEMAKAGAAAKNPAITWTLALVQTAAGDHADAIKTARRLFPNAFDKSGDTLPSAAWKIIYPAPYREAVRQASEAESLPYLLSCSVIRQESLWDSAAVSHAGALGLMQLMPPTARSLARQIGAPAPTAGNLTDPGWNTRVGCAFLSRLLGQYRGRLHLALAAYNAGPGRVAEWKARKGCPTDPDLFIESIPFWETRAYIRKILLNLWEYERLYPELKGPGDRAYLVSAGFEPKG